MGVPTHMFPFPRASRARIDRSFERIVKLAGRKNTSIRNFERELRKMGLCVSRVLEPILGHFGLPQKDFDLTLKLDEHTLRIPWELALCENKDEGFLCERVSIGRTREVTAEGGFELPRPRKAYRALVVGISCKGCKTCEPLDFAEKEATGVKSCLDRFGRGYGLTVAQFIKNRVDRKLLEQEIQKGVNVFHFTGHGSVSGRVSQICIGGGRKLTVEDMLSMCENSKVPTPIFSFVNACETSVESARWKAHNWAYAMADRGGRACIGTFWSVQDESSLTFSKRFYKEFFAEGKTLGESMRQARLETKTLEDGASILTWPAYVLYGRPTIRRKDILV